jgi:hypothetical protein
LESFAGSELALFVLGVNAGLAPTEQGFLVLAFEFGEFEGVGRLALLDHGVLRVFV